MYMSASLPCISWNSPIGWPNCLRSCTYGNNDVEAGGHDAERPAGEHRALVVEARHQDFHAFALFPKIFSEGTSQSRNTSSQVFEPRMPSLSSFCAVEKPFIPFSTRNAVMPLIAISIDHQDVGVGPVRDPHLVAVQDVALPAPALSFIPTTSEPAPGSDMASAPTCSPETSFGRYFFFCASLPLRRIWFTHRFGARRTKARSRPSRARSPPSRRCARGTPSPAAVVFLDRDAEQPERAELAPEVGGNSFVSSICAARGAISSR